MRGGGLVAPLDVGLAIKQHDTVGRGLHGRQEILQPRLALLGLALALAQHAPHTLGEFFPNTRFWAATSGTVQAQPV
ncbi:MAG: hypothetical protein AUK51_01400 [Comamonadaceae bacterium CG2_30_59_20]|nr:MAG: hypothetical protein AUK51_01400 [Comamonadaceae bacterium CG2_30_59_20]